jgi:hypothetical protein
MLLPRAPHPWQVRRTVPTDPTADQIALLVQRLTEFGEKMRALESEYGERRRQLIAESGLPPGLAERVLRESTLTSVSKVSNTLDTMSTAEMQIPTPRGRKFTARHPLPARAKALGKPIRVVADDISKALKRKIPRTTVRSWYAAKGSESARPIPRDAIAFFEAPPWNIPPEAWKNGTSSSD